MVKKSKEGLTKSVDYKDKDQEHRSLPPNVTGITCSHLILTIGKILWNNDSTDSVCIKCNWWGEVRDGYIFRDIEGNLQQGKRCIKSVSYDICCSFKQFSHYLNDMGFFTLDVMKKERGLFIGIVKIPEIKFLTPATPVRGIFAVVNSKNEEIAKLQVHIALEKFLGTDCDRKPLDTSSIPKNGESNSSPCTFQSKSEKHNEKVSDYSQSATEDLIVALLEKGHQLRKAMIISSLDDEIDNSFLKQKLPLNGIDNKDLSFKNAAEYDILKYSSDNTAELISHFNVTKLYDPKSINNYGDDSEFSENFSIILSENEDPIHDDFSSSFLYRQANNSSAPKKSHQCWTEEIQSDSSLPDSKNAAEELLTEDILPELDVEKILELGHISAMKIFIGKLYIHNEKRLLSNKRKKISYLILEFKLPLLSKGTIADRTSELCRAQIKYNNNQKVYKFNHHETVSLAFDAFTLKNWQNDELSFNLFLRFIGQKSPELLGKCKMHLSSVLKCSKFYFEEKLNLISDNETSCDVLGKLEISIHLISSLSSGSKPIKDIKKDGENRNTIKTVKENITYSDNKESHHIPQNISQNRVVIESIPQLNIELPTLQIILMIPEGRNLSYNFFKPKQKNHMIQASLFYPGSTYLVCKMFWCSQAIKSKLCPKLPNPHFDLLQVSLVNINYTFLEFSKNNIMVVEVWQQIIGSSDQLVGIAKLPLHDFYLSLIREISSQGFFRSQQPILAIDNYIPITDPFSGNQCGQLKALLALGTVEQIRNLQQQKLEGSKSIVKSDCFENSKLYKGKRKYSDQDDNDDKVYHIFEICIKGISDFKIPERLVWGESDCFVQYLFPVQQKKHSEKYETQFKTFKTGLSLCVPDLVFDYTHCHKLHCIATASLETVFNDIGDLSEVIPFQLWSQEYYPNVHNQIIAETNLPLSKLYALTKLKKDHHHSNSEYSLPLHHDNSSKLTYIGLLNIVITYNIKDVKNQNPQLQLKSSTFNSQVFIAVHLLQLCGLQSAVFTFDKDMSKILCFNIFVKIKLSFLSKQEEFVSPVFDNCFALEPNIIVDFPCTLFMPTENGSLITLGEILETADAIIEVWHQQDFKSVAEEHVIDYPSDVLLGICKIPLQLLLVRKTGRHGWFPIINLHKSSRLVQNPDTPRCLARIIGGLEININFTHPDDDGTKVIASALTNGYSVKSLQDKWNVSSCDNDQLVCVAVDFIFIQHSAKIVLNHSEEQKTNMICLQYKLHNLDTENSIVHKFDSSLHMNNMIRTKYQQEHLLEASPSLGWYLKEEQLEIQLWKLDDTEETCQPFYIGSAFIDLCGLVSDWSKSSSISGEYPLFKESSDNMGSSYIRVHILRKPLTKAHFTPISDVNCDQNKINFFSDKSILADAKIFPSDLKDNTKYQDEKQLLKCHIIIERADHLPLVTAFRSNQSVKPNCYVSCHATKTAIVTPIIEQNQYPQWNFEEDTFLTRELLTSDSKGIIFKLWHKSASLTSISDLSSQMVDNSPDRVIGFVSVDLCPLLSGLKHIYGWYNIIDFAGQCQGQIKIGIVVLDNDDDLSSQLSLSDHFVEPADEQKLFSKCQSSNVFPTSTKEEEKQSLNYEYNVPCNLSDLYNKLNQHLADLDQLHCQMKEKLITEEAITQTDQLLIKTSNEDLKFNGKLDSYIEKINYESKLIQVENPQVPKLNLDNLSDEDSFQAFHRCHNVETQTCSSTSEEIPFQSTDHIIPEIHKRIDVQHWLENNLQNNPSSLSLHDKNPSSHIKDLSEQAGNRNNDVIQSSKILNKFNESKKSSATSELSSDNLYLRNTEDNRDNDFIQSLKISNKCNESKKNSVTSESSNDNLSLRSAEAFNYVKMHTISEISSSNEKKTMKRGRNNTANWLARTWQNKNSCFCKKIESRCIENNCLANTGNTLKCEWDKDALILKSQYKESDFTKAKDLKKMSHRKVHFASNDITEIIPTEGDNETQILSPIEECDDTSQSEELETETNKESSNQNENCLSLNDSQENASELFKVLSKSQYKLSCKENRNNKKETISDTNQSFMLQELIKNSQEKQILISDYSKERFYNQYLKETKMTGKKKKRLQPRIPEFLHLEGL